MILQHEYREECRHRFYLQWPKDLDGKISDITYCKNADKFLISTWDTSQLYLFDRNLLSITEAGELSRQAPLRRIHCYGKTIYCIWGNNYLLEYQLDEQNAKINFIDRITVFDAEHPSRDTPYHLLDVTCNENYIIVVYPNANDEIHLQSIDRRTKALHSDFRLDDKHPINQAHIRIESTKDNNGNCIFLNGSQKHLKSIDFVNSNKGKITSTIRPHKNPTNLCFLNDGRLVILNEAPHFLSIHDLANRKERY